MGDLRTTVLDEGRWEQSGGLRLRFQEEVGTAGLHDSILDWGVYVRCPVSFVGDELSTAAVGVVETRRLSVVYSVPAPCRNVHSMRFARLNQ